MEALITPPAQQRFLAIQKQMSRFTQQRVISVKHVSKLLGISRGYWYLLANPGYRVQVDSRVVERLEKLHSFLKALTHEQQEDLITGVAHIELQGQRFGQQEDFVLVVDVALPR